MQKKEKKQKKVVFQLKTGEVVTIPYLGSLGKKRLNPISKALSTIDGSVNRTLIKEAVDLGSELGNTHYLRVNEQSESVYAKPQDSDHYCRYLKGVRPERCSHIALILDLLPETGGGSGVWTLRRHYLGTIAALHPGEEGFSESDKLFWQTHGIYFANNKVQLNTLTETIPDELSFLR